MSLISIDPSNLLSILVTTALTQPRTATGRSWESWWNVIPWALIYALLVLIFIVRVINAVHDSRAPSELLQPALAKRNEVLDTVGVAVTILVLTWAFFDRFWRPCAIQRQRNPANGDDVELQILGGRDDAPQPHHEPIEQLVQGEGVWNAGEMDIEAGGELRNVDGLDVFVVNMPGAFPV